MLKKRLLSILTLLLIAAAAVLSAAAAVTAQEPNHAGLVIVLPDGETLTRCVAFAEDEISGFEAMSRSGLTLETTVSGMGATICSVETVGCPADDCFCQCKGGGDCVYWSYWHLQDGGWDYSQAGAGNYRLHDGAVDGWVWGPGTPNKAIEPPQLTFDDICAEPDLAAAGKMTNDESSGQSWLGYALFGAIVLGLGGVLVTKRRAP